jgi:hypothetical protein
MNIELNLRTHTRQARWRRQHPRKYFCHIAVQRALASGQLVKGPCETCGTTLGRIDAHHDSYEPGDELKVRWLCRRHHIRLHNGGEDMFAEVSRDSRVTVA